MANGQDEIEKLPIEEQLRCLKLQEEKKKIELERKELERKSKLHWWRKPLFIQAIIAGIIAAPVLWFYVKDVALPLSSRENIKLSKELKERNQELIAERKALDEMILQHAKLQNKKIQLETETENLKQEKEKLLSQKIELQDLFKRKGEELTKNFAVSTAALEQKLINKEKQINEYIALLGNLEGKKIDASKPLPEKTSENLKQYEEKLAQVKTEDEYSPTDWFYKGLSEFGKKEYDKAIENYSKAIELDPEFVDAYNNRGNTYQELKQYDKSIEDFNKAIELDPEHTKAYFNRGASYGNLKQYDKAIESFSKAIELDPEHTKAYFNRGTVYGDLKQYDKAIEDYNKAIESDPDYAAAYNNRGNIYKYLKQYDKAIEDFRKVIELDPENVIAIKNISELKKYNQR